MQSSPAKPRRDLWAIPALWFLGAALFIPLLRNRFIGDDYTALSISRLYRAKPFLETILYGGNDFFRPLNMALIMARGALFGDNPLYYVIANILLHLVNTTLVFLIARRVFKSAVAPVIAGALFVVAFNHYEAITWISGSITLFVTFFTLVALYFHMRFREEGKLGWFFAALAGFILAFLTQEAAIALPLLIVVYDLIMVKREERRKVFFYPYIVYGALLAIYIFVQFGWAFRFIGPDSIYRPGWHILTNIADYWVWLWMPNPRHPYVAGVLSVLPRPVLIVYWIVAGIVALTLPLVIVLAALKRLSRPILWSFLSALVALLVFLPFTIKISARYPYLPSVGISLFAGGLFAWLWAYLKERGKKVWQGILVGAASFYLAANVLGLILIQREFVRVSTTTQRLAIKVGELVELKDNDVLFIEGLPQHVHLNEAVQWYWNPNVEVYATNDAYRGTPKTLDETRKFYAGKGAELYFISFDDGELKLVSTERL